MTAVTLTATPAVAVGPPAVLRKRGPRILFFAQERDTWRVARSVGYTAQLGLTEGLAASGAEVFTLTNQCRNRVADLCAGRQFDQLWVHVYPYRLDAQFWAWASKAAPVRLGLVPESLTYTEDELTVHPGLSRLGEYFDQVQPHLTHVAAVDEVDVSRLNATPATPALWWPQAVPNRWIDDAPAPPVEQKALFIGEPYGERGRWLRHEDLRSLLAVPRSPEAGTPYPALFEALNVNIQRYLHRRWLPGAPIVARAYLAAWAVIRRRTFALWMRALQRGVAVVNLPHWVKGYSGRVVEAMAAGRPVVSWAIPDRPRNAALFADGEEILLYRPGDVAELADRLQRIIGDRALAERLAATARRNVRRYHTTERRVAEMLEWIEHGTVPAYGLR